jgi:serpin B
MNHCVAAQTHDRIPQIVSKGDLPPTTRLVLTNAVYFKGKWDRPFAESHTRPRLFAGVSGGAYVPTMAQQGSFRYAREGSVQVLELTYGGDLSMVVVLPDDAADLPTVDRKLARNYADWLAALRPTLVDLWLPRWTSRSRLDLGAKLQAAGMRLAFAQSAADLLSAARCGGSVCLVTLPQGIPQIATIAQSLYGCGKGGLCSVNRRSGKRGLGKLLIVPVRQTTRILRVV